MRADARSGPGTGELAPASGPRWRSVRPFAAAALVGALIWVAWLGWDRRASYDVVTGTVQDPYVTLQVVGCAVSVGVAVALFAARYYVLSGAGGVATGFWVVWVIDAYARDDSGLFVVGAVLLALGLAIGTAAAAGIGVALGALFRALRR